MLVDLKEQMKEQQAQSVRDRKQAALDCDNTAREQEALKQHNNQLYAQIVALKRTQGQMQPEDEPGIGEALVNGPITSLRQSIPTSLLREDYSDNEADSSRF